MTGIYVRVKNKYTGKYENKEIEYLSIQEREELFKDTDKERLLRYIDRLSAVIQSIAKQGY